MNDPGKKKEKKKEIPTLTCHGLSSAHFISLFFFFFFSFDSTRGSRTGNFHPPRKEK
jgi:hypothetical protein